MLIEFGDKGTLEIQPTEEGLVIDAYWDGIHQGGVGKTYVEWFESLLGECIHCGGSLVTNQNHDIIDIETESVLCEDHYHCTNFEPSLDGWCLNCRLTSEKHNEARIETTMRLPNPDEPGWEQLELDLNLITSTKRKTRACACDHCMQIAATGQRYCIECWENGHDES